MPIAQFQDPPNKVNIVRNFPTPKRVTDPNAWFKEVRKVMPDIIDDAYWIESFDASLSIIAITLRKTTGERAYVAIQRTRGL